MQRSFVLPQTFVNAYKDKEEPFGFNGLGKVTFYRTYSRPKPSGGMESWAEVCERVINFMYSVQKNSIMSQGKPWDEQKAVRSAQDAYDRLFHLKWSPPGRGLFIAGTDFIYDRENVEALNNCSFISTADIHTNGPQIFGWAMDMLMLGVGVGFDVRGAMKATIQNNSKEDSLLFVIHDSREGWVESLEQLLAFYLTEGASYPNFDYSVIREKGQPIKGFGGTSSGYAPLKKLHQRIDRMFAGREGDLVGTTDIADIFNMIGACVIAGNVRRSAEIALGAETDEFLSLKNYAKNPQREAWGWGSNNSVIIEELGGNYSKIAERILDNGEPGLFFQPNVTQFGRMGTFRHDPATGTNPCAEQFLESYEMCTLSEIYLNNHSSIVDFLKTIKYAYLYAKSVSLTNDFISDEKTRKVMMRNRRIGLSLTGITEFIAQNSLSDLIKFMEVGYNEVQRYDHVYSEWLAVPNSIRTTTVKPSGTVSLLAGSTPGIHFPMSEYYIRRIKIADNSPMLPYIKEAGYFVEEDENSDNTMVISFPVKVHAKRSEKDVSPWEQLKLAAIAQKSWSDNGVSVTVKFDPDKTTKEDIEAMLDHYQYELKAVSMLPDRGMGAYAQMPYETITKERYEAMMEKILPVNFDAITNSRDSADMYCDGDACLIV